MSETIAAAVEPTSAPTAPARPGMPAMLSHAAYVTHDTAATAEFFTKILGMELVAAVMDDTIPSTGDPVPYFHSFYRMADGSTVAFFEAPELPEQGADPHPAYAIFNHLALEVESPALVDAWHEWLVANDVEVLGPVDHKIIYSIYFHEPGGLRMELTTPLDPGWNDHAEAARAGLEEWQAVKDQARESGQSVVDVLAELTRRRSHQHAG